MNNIKTLIFDFDGTIADTLPHIINIVNDYVNMFPDAPEVTSTNYNQWFGNEYGWAAVSPHIRVKHSSHMKNKKYNGMNTATKKAQTDAADIAREKTYSKFGLKGNI